MQNAQYKQKNVDKKDEHLTLNKLQAQMPNSSRIDILTNLNISGTCASFNTNKKKLPDGCTCNDSKKWLLVTHATPSESATYACQ
jgi:hypothetical protein